MPFDNLNARHYQAEEKTAIDDNLQVLETTLMSKIQNLSPEERQKYGRVNEQNKLLINKTRDYRKSQPGLSSPDIDWEEFTADYESREFIESVILRLQNMIDGLSNNKILHDYDNYQAALTDYDYSKYKAGTRNAGFENKINEISQFFPRTGTAGKVEEPSSN